MRLLIDPKIKVYRFYRVCLGKLFDKEYGHSRKLSGRRDRKSGNRGNVQFGKCPIGELSGRGMVSFTFFLFNALF